MSRVTDAPHAVILVQNLPVPFDRRVWMEATALRENGYRVTVICPTSPQHPQTREHLEGISIRRFPLLHEGRGTIGMIVEYIWSILAMSYLALTVALRQPTAIAQVCNPPDLLFICTWPLRLIRRSRIIFDQHDLGPELLDVKGYAPESVIGRLVRFAERCTYRSADVVISTNESYRDIAINRGGKSPDRVFVVRSAPRRAFAVEALAPIEDIASVARLVYLGTMGSQEGIDLLLAALTRIRAALPEVSLELHLIGDGPERPFLQMEAERLGVANICHFHGRVSDGELREIVTACDIAVNPDRPSPMNNLSSMNKIVEYMALGVPMVQFEQLEGRRTAVDASVYVTEATSDALGDAIADLLRDVERRDYMRRFGLERFLQDLSWETQAPNLVAAYSAAQH